MKRRQIQPNQKPLFRVKSAVSRRAGRGPGGLILLGIVSIFVLGIFLWGPSTSADLHPMLLDAPGPASTGVPSETVLSPATSMTVTEDGAVIDSVDLVGRIYVKADNVSILNSRINANGGLYGIRMDRNVEGLTIIDSEIFGARTAAVGHGNYKAIRLNVHSSRDGFLMGGGSLVRDTWIHGMYDHGVGIRSFGSGPISVLSNHIESENGRSRSSAVEIRSAAGNAPQLTLDGNVLRGGHDTLRIYAPDSSQVEVANNLWIDDTWRRSPAKAFDEVRRWQNNETAGGVIMTSPASGAPLVIDSTPTSVVVTLVTTETTDGVGSSTTEAPTNASTTETTTEASTTTDSVLVVSTETTTAPSVPTSSTTTSTPSTSEPTSTAVSPTTTVGRRSTTTSQERATSTTARQTTTTVAGSGTTCAFSNPNDPKDDPNPGYNGSSGRYNVSSNAIPAGYPTPLSTGICGVGLDPSDLQRSGSIKVTQDGAVIEGLDIDGAVVVKANNVTIRRSRITSSSGFVVHLESGYSNLTIEDTRIRSIGAETIAAAKFMGFATITRSHISGGNDALKGYGGVLLEDSYVTGIYRRADSHNDIFQVHKGSNFTLRGNSLIGPWQAGTSVLIFQAKVGDISDVLIEGNYISGGGYSVYTTKGNGYSLNNVAVRGNRFELGSWKHNWYTNNGGATYNANTQVPS